MDEILTLYAVVPKAALDSWSDEQLEEFIYKQIDSAIRSAVKEASDRLGVDAYPPVK